MECSPEPMNEAANRAGGTGVMPNPRLRVAIVAASLRWVGGQSVQADLLLRHWQNDPEVEARFVPVDPDLPRWLAWAGRIPFVRTILRIPFYLRELWEAAGNEDLLHVFSASYWSFLVAPVPAWLIGCLRGTKVLINYHSGEARDHLSRWRTASPVLRRVDAIAVPSAFLVDVFREFGLEAQAVPNIVTPASSAIGGESHCGRGWFVHADSIAITALIWWFGLLRRSKRNSRRPSCGWRARENRNRRFAPWLMMS